jgi:oxygen-independent coproporphyrinogen-3 oxidase
VRHLYLHIPFCHRRCSYCAFNTYANIDERIAPYVDALCAEIEMRRQGEGIAEGIRDQRSELCPLVPPVTRADLMPTIFLGGGTPTMLTLAQIEQVLTAAGTLVPLDQAEITVEANPGTVLGGEYLRGLCALGVNRISMGIQSLHDPTLRMLGRIHTAAEARTSFEDARRAGFERINLDFIFGLPGQTVEQWDATLREMTTWGADHFSLYSLILEEGTPLHAQVLGGRISVPDDDVTGEMYELAIERFAAAGYRQYEISNWARNDPESSTHTIEERDAQSKIQNPESKIPNQACHHNLAYWLNADYLACGAGAHGHRFPQRYYDLLGVDAYIARVEAGALPVAEVTELSRQDLYAETMFMGLRLNTGVSYAHFRDRCDAGLEDIYGPTLDDLVELGLLQRDALGVQLTSRGRLLGNQVFLRFVGSEE